MDKKIFINKKSARQSIKESIRDNKNILNNKNLYPDLDENKINTIAKINTNMHGFIDSLSDSIEILGQAKKQKTSFFKDTEEIGRSIYSNLKKGNFFDYLKNNLNILTSDLKKNQSGEELLSSVIETNGVINLKTSNYNKTTQSGMVDFKNLLDATENFDKIIKNGGNIITYDLETLGGLNSYGHQQIDYITELSASVLEYTKDGKSKEIKTINSLLGFSDDEYKNVKKYIEGLKNKPLYKQTNRDKVYLKRLSLLTDPTFKYTQKGFDFRVKNADPDSVVTSIDNALKGIEEYRKIGIEQEKWLKSNNVNKSLSAYKQEYMQSYADLVYKGTYDNKTLKNYISLAHNSANFDDKAIGILLGKNIEHSPGKGFDSYQVIKYIQENLGQNAHMPKGLFAIKNFGLGTQDQLKHLLKNDSSNVGAHNAYEDAISLVKILTDKNINTKNGNISYQEFLSSRIHAVNDKIGKLKGKHLYEKREGIYLMDKTSQKDWGSNKNGLSFTYNPIDDSFKTFDGFRITNDGNVLKESFNGFGPKKNALYTHEEFKINLKKDNWKRMFENLNMSNSEIEKFYQEYSNLDYLYVVKSKEYKDNNLIEKKFGKNSIQNSTPVHFRVFTSEDQLATSKGVKVAYKNKNGTASFLEDVLNDLQLKTIEVNNKNKIEIKDVKSTKDKVNMLLDRSSYVTSVDSAARTIRDMNYDRLAKMRRYEKENGLSISTRISELVSKNNKLTIPITEELIDDLGWYDFGIKNKKLLPETISKASILDNYSNALNPIFESMETVFKKMGIEDSFKIKEKTIGNTTKKIIESTNNKALKVKKNILFQNVMTNVLEELTNDISVINNLKPTIFTESELNKIDFLRKDLFPEKEARRWGYSLSNSNNKYVTLDLNNNNSLINLFYNNQFDKIDISKKSNAGFTSLFRAYDTIAEDSRFAGVWGNLTHKDLLKYQNEGNLDQLNSIMTEKLQKFVNIKRTDDSSFGLSFPRMIQDYSDVSTLETLLKDATKKDKNKIFNIVEKTMKNSIKDVYVADENNNNLVNEIVDKYFMTFSEKDFNSQIKNLTNDQQKVLKAQYGFAMQESKERASDLIEAIKNTDMNLLISKSGKESTMSLMHNNEIQALNMHKYVLNNGIINHSINDIEYSTNFSYNVKDLINRRGKIKNNNTYLFDGIDITSNVQEALGRTRSLTETIKFAQKNNDADLFDTLIRKINKDSNILREVGPRKERINYNNTIERAMQINTNSLISILPELEDSGLIDNINSSFKVSEKNSQDMRKLIDKIRNSEYRPREISDLLASEQNLFYQIYDNPLLLMINDKVKFNTVNGVNIKDIAKMINPHLQDTKFAEGKQSLNTSPFSNGAAKFDKSSRSVSVQQGNAILYDKDKMKEDINRFLKNNKDLKNNVSIGGKISNRATEQFVNKNGKHTAGLTLKYLQIDSNSLKDLFIDDVEKVRLGDKENRFSKFLNSNYSSDINLEKASKVLSEKAMSLSTYEQQSAINARISYIAFSKNNKQIINNKKELIISHTKNIGVIEANKKSHKLPVVINKDGIIEYKLGYEVNKGQTLGMFGSETNIIRSRYNGIFRSRYVNEYGDIVSEKELNNFIKNNNLGKNPDELKVKKLLDKKYNLQYEVINKFEDYGHKLYNDASEKSTADVMDIGVGLIDKKLAEELEDSGFKNLSGRVLSREYIETYLTPALNKKNLDSKKIINRMLKERFAFSDSLSLWDELKDVSQITNLNFPKHESISAAVTNIVEKISKDKEMNKDKEIYYKALFGIDKQDILKDGTLLFDNINSIKLSNFSGLNEAQEIKLNNILKKSDKIGQGIAGHKGYSHVIHAHDDASGTYSSDLEISKLKNQYSELTDKLEIAKYEKNEKQIEKLQAKRLYIDNNISKISTQKGLKFDNRMNLNLQKNVYDNDSIKLAFENIKDKNEFFEYFQHAVDKDGNVKNSYLGKSILDPVTSIMRDRALIGFGETKLSEIDKHDREKYKYLLNSYKDNLDNISVEKAEKLYSYQQGVRALEFNNSNIKTGTFFDELTTKSKHDYNKFKLVDLSGLSKKESSELFNLDVGGQGKTITSTANNPYTNNIMLKTGLGGKEDYLAIARMPEKHFEENLIKTSHIQKLSELQNALSQFHTLEGEDKIHAEKYARSVVNEIVDSQKHDITSKNGLYGDLISSRLSQTFFGKASGLSIKTTKALGEDTYENLQKLNNSHFLDRATFEGKTLLKHYQEGKVIDAVGVSRQAYEDMGYFNERFIKQALGKNGTVEKMEEALEQHGDMFLATRFPRIQEASDKVVLGFLDKNLKGNQIMALAHTGASMNLDHDGDQFAIGRITNEKGESYFNYLQQGLNKDDFFYAQEASLMERALNTNRYWDSKIRKKIGDEYNVAIKGNRIEDIAKSRIIDNEVFSSLIDKKDMTISNMTNLEDKYGSLIKTSIEDGSHEKAVKYLSNNFAGEAFNQAKKDYATAYSFQLLKDEIIAKSSKNAIGEINVTNYKIKTLLTGLMDKTEDSYNYKSSLVFDMMHLSEQAAISAKSSIEGLNPDRAKIWNENAMNFIKGKGNSAEQKEAMINWSNEYLMNDLDVNMYWEKSNYFRNIAEKTINNGNSLTKEHFDTLLKSTENRSKLQGRMINDFMDTLTSLKNNNYGVEKAIDYMSLGHSLTGVTKPINSPTVMKNFENVSDKVVQVAKNSEEEIQGHMRFLSLQQVLKESNLTNDNVIDNVISNSDEYVNKKTTMNKIMEGTTDLFKSVKSSKIALGALGIAAGVMMLGYVGGRPRPADTQAMEEAQDYQSPQLMDSNLNINPMQGSQQGYVVNINARSDKGRDHAISAIQQAISSGTSSSVNISMNINDNYGNISDRDIEKIIKDAL